MQRDTIVNRDQAHSPLARSGARYSSRPSSEDLLAFAMARLAQSRDPETGEHLLRMRCYAQLLAEELGRKGPYREMIDEAYLADLYRCSPLHDIGKVAIPDVVLLKPGRLSDSEYLQVQQHTTAGAQVIDDLLTYSPSTAFLNMARDVVRSHHERFDGTGYPDGLAGMQIPLAARIVAVADVYDALTSERVYKEAYSSTIAQSMIIRESGAHFDPVVVEAFEACLPAIRRAQNEMTDPPAGSAKSAFAPAWKRTGAASDYAAL